MRRATTPTVEIDIDQPLTGMWYRVAFEQRGVAKIVKDEGQCELSADGRTVTVRLTQEETLAFSDRLDVRVQIRYGDGHGVAATNIAAVPIGEILDEEVV